MGFNKKYLPELHDLKVEYKERGHSEFVRTYLKYDTLIGSDESFKFLTKKLTKKTK
jgi:hypothetical protein